MTGTDRLKKAAAAVVIAGCALLVIGDAVRIVAGSSDASIPGGVGWFTQAVGAMLVVPGLPALYARQAQSAPVLGLMAFVGLNLFMFLFGIFGGLLHSLVVVELARSDPNAAIRPVSVALSFFAGSMGAVVGGTGFGGAVIRGKGFPSHAGILAAVGGILLFIGHPLGMHIEDAGLWLLLGGVADGAWAVFRQA